MTISATDDSGVVSGATVSFTLGPNQSKQITAQDLEFGNFAKGLTGSLGDGNGKWRHSVTSSLDLEVMSLIRTQDGFLTNLSATVLQNSVGHHVIYFANPASEIAQGTFLRLINTSDESGLVTISAVDDEGNVAPGGNVMFEFGPNESKQITASDLEAGNPDKGLMGLLGEGSGRWRLTVESELDLQVMSLIRTPDGFLTNLSRTTPVTSGANKVFVFNPASNSNQRSSLRIVNDSMEQASVTISAIDDDGESAPNGAVTFNVASGVGTLISAQDLEQGNTDIVGSLGDGAGKWRFTVSSEVDLAVQSLLDTPTGFLTNLSGASSSVSVTPAEQTVVTDSTTATSRLLSLKHVVNAESRNAVCNDGSDAAYYYDAGFGTGEDKWIVYLEGGSLCFNANSCLVRVVTSPDLTSSSNYPDNISTNGIFVADETINPDFHNWHMVYAKYCSSDLWSGSKEETGDPGEFHFRGYDILVALLEDLQSDDEFGTNNLGNAKEMIFAGSSAGAGGVIVQLDRVAALVDHLDVKGLPDSLFYDPDVKDFTSIFDPPALIEFQGSVLDESCMAGEIDPSMCGEPMTAIRYLETPFFIVADQSDPVINGFFLQADPTAFAAGVREELATLEQGYSPDAAVHVWVNDSLFYRYRVNGISVLDAFSNWYFDRGGVRRVIQQPD